MAQVLAHLAHEAFFGEDQRLIEALGYLLGGQKLPLLGAACVVVATAAIICGGSGGSDGVVGGVCGDSGGGCCVGVARRLSGSCAV